MSTGDDESVREVIKDYQNDIAEAKREIEKTGQYRTSNSYSHNSYPSSSDLANVEESENWMDKLKRDNAEWEEKEQAKFQSLNARRIGRDTYDVKQLDDKGGLSKSEREELDRASGYKRKEDDIFW